MAKLGNSGAEVLEGNVDLVTSDELLSEFNKVITRQKFRRYITSLDLIKFRIILNQQVTVISIKTRFSEIKEDPQDNVVLETFYNARTDYIVSGDKHILNLKEFKGIKMVTIEEMLQILRRGS